MAGLVSGACPGSQVLLPPTGDCHWTAPVLRSWPRAPLWVMVTSFGSPWAGSVSAGEEWLSMPPWVSLAHSWPQLARSMATSVLLESVCR